MHARPPCRERQVLNFISVIYFFSLHSEQKTWRQVVQQPFIQMRNIGLFQEIVIDNYLLLLNYSISHHKHRLDSIENLKCFKKKKDISNKTVILETKHHDKTSEGFVLQITQRGAPAKGEHRGMMASTHRNLQRAAPLCLHD